jgi:HSP20 family protein
MLRFPLSMFDDDLDNWFFPESRAVSRRTRAGYPPFNVGVTDKNVDLYLFIPAMDPEMLDVVIEKNLLSVAGTRKLAEQDEQQGSYSLKERFDGDFKRVITLPEDVDTDSVEANYEDGVLHIRVAKPVVSQPRQIQINVN